MKSRILKIGISSILFFSMIFASLVLVRPVIHGFTQKLETYRDKVLSMVEAKTGLRISYDSLSPAILSVFRIKGIVVSDVKTENTLLSIHKAQISYSIPKLLSGDVQGAFSKLSISGIELEYDGVKNSHLLEKLMALVSSENTSGSTDSKLNGLIVRLPFDIEIDNVSLRYYDNLVDAHVLFKDIEITDTPSQGFLSLQALGQCLISVQDGALASTGDNFKKILKDISLVFSMDASVLPKLDGSTAGIKLASISNEEFSVARTSLFAEYNEGLVSVSTIQSNLPFLLMGEMSLDTGELRFLADMEEFEPFSYVRVKRDIPLLENLRETRISGEYEFQINANTLAFGYSGAGSLFLPEKLLSEAFLPEGVLFDYKFSGNTTDIEIASLDIENKNLNFSLEGSFNIPNLRATGFAFLERLTVPGSGDISAELYIDALDRGFTCFIPQLYYGDRSFTALQLTMIPDSEAESIDFEFEASDYSHVDFGVPGLLQLSGSFLNEEKPYLQANLQINDFFIDSALHAASFFVPQETRTRFDSLSTSLSSFVTTNELYIATDFSSFSYNVDYWILADASNDDNLLIFSFTGNETTLNLSQFDLLFAGQNIQMTAAVDVDDEYTQLFFNTDLSVNSLPYSLSGSYTFGSWLNLTGSYGLVASLSLNGEENMVEGQLQMAELPLAIGPAMVLCSMETSGFVPRDNPSDFRIDVGHLGISEVSNVLFTNPQLSVAGHISNYGFLLEHFLFQDEVSTLDGSGGVMWNFSQGILETAGLNLSLGSAVTSEAYNIGMSFSNPEQKDFSRLNFLQDVYFSAQIDVNKLPMARFRPMQNEGNVLTGAITAMGTIENPYISIAIEPSSVSFGGLPFNFTAKARLDDGEVFLDEAEVQSGSMSVTDVSANFSLANLSGFLHAQFDANLGDVYTINVPLDVNVTSSLADEGSATTLTDDSGNTLASPKNSGFVGIVTTLARGLPELISVDLSAQLGGNLFSEPEMVEINLVRIPGYIMINSKNELGISGSITEEGYINMNLSDRMPIHAVVQGSVAEEGLDLYARNISSDLSKFKGLVTFPFIMLHGGHLTGNFHIGGIIADPKFDGQLLVSNLVINCPDYVPELMTAPQAIINLQDSELSLDNVYFAVADSSAYLDLRLVMDRLMLDILTIDVRTPGNVMVPALVNIPATIAGAPSVLIEGKSTCDLNIEVTLSSVEVRGRFFVDDVDIDIVSAGIQGQNTRQEGLIYPSGSGRMTKIFDIGITTGQHVELFFDPLLRGLIAPNTKGTFRYDSSTGVYSIDSDIVLRGGEINYLNRNFYLREGRVVFDENDSLDPIITVRAEIREHDQNGEPVRITLSAENQRLSQFTPSYSSSPPKSEMELMSILGQALTGDVQSGWDILLSGVDYGFNMLVLRKIENALRDFLNFDIFSLRTMGLQNSLKQWLNVGEKNQRLTVGNFFDNTTVYIGKYFGSSIYADAMLHFAYDEKKALEDGTSSGLNFQPEIGLEMDSPFGAIRWSFAPDLENPQHLWVPSTSISLSWKFSL